MDVVEVVCENQYVCGECLGVLHYQLIAYNFAQRMFGHLNSWGETCVCSYSLKMPKPTM